MVNDLRVYVQSKLDEIDGLSSGVIVGDSMIEEGKYYFGYRFERVGNGFNLDYSDKSEFINITGFLSTKGGTLQTLDDFTDRIIDILHSLRFNVSVEDVTTLDTKIRKVSISGVVSYNYIDGQLK